MRSSRRFPPTCMSAWVVLAIGVVGLLALVQAHDMRRRSRVAAELARVGRSVRLEEASGFKVMAELDGQIWVASSDAELDELRSGRQGAARCIWPRVSRSAAMEFAGRHGMSFVLMDRTS